MNKLAKDIKKSGEKFDFIYGIPRGGWVVAVALSHRLGIPVAKFRVNEKVLVVDDISDSGGTLKDLRRFKIATIFVKDKSTVKPDFYWKKIREEIWIEFPWEVK